jgi:hypothetical protein
MNNDRHVNAIRYLRFLFHRNQHHQYTIFILTSQRLLDYLAFQPSGFESTWWSLFQKHIVRTKLDIYVFINTQV